MDLESAIKSNLLKAAYGKVHVYGIDNDGHYHRLAAVRVQDGEVQGSKVTGGWVALKDYALLRPSMDLPLSF